ncbi:MAG: glutathione S-transferase family protein [Rhodospirillales bacterium]
MILIGQLDSPFARRVAVSMHHYGMPFERKPLSVFAHQADVRGINPLGRVPALVLDSGETLIDSQMILDYLDELAGPDRALTPAKGPERRRVLLAVAVALGAAEKIVALNVETKRRAPGTTDPRIVQRFSDQTASALRWLEAQQPDPWFMGAVMTQADVTATAMLTHLVNRQSHLFTDGAYPMLKALRERAEALPPFQAAPFMDG